MLQPRAALITLSQAYCAATGRSLARVSTLAQNSGRFLRQVEEGGDFTIGTYEKVVRWFAANWPADVAWPEGVARPEIDEAAA